MKATQCVLSSAASSDITLCDGKEGPFAEPNNNADQIRVGSHSAKKNPTYQRGIQQASYDLD